MNVATTVNATDPAAVARWASCARDLQITAVSQISLLGVSADLTPLVVASVGLLAGSLPGAVDRLRRSACSSTSRSCRRSGSPRCCSSRSATGPAACARCATPRTRSRRSPSAPPPPRSRDRLRDHPVPARRRRARSAGCSARDPLDRSPRTRCWPCRSTRSCAASRARAARGPAPPPPRRAYRPAACRPLHDAPSPPRRSGLRSDDQSHRRPPPADHAAARAARRDPRRRRAGPVRDHLLPPVVPAGPLRATSTSRRPRQPRARHLDPGAARRHHRPQRHDARRQSAWARDPDPADKLPPRGPERTASTAPDEVIGCARRARSPQGDHDGSRLPRARRCRTRTSRSRATRRSPARLHPRAPEQFPGVAPEQVYLRRYPHKQLAAQLFGTVGQISPKELKMSRFRGVHQGSIVGQGGIEWSYDRYLRGQEGATRVQVDALGRQKGAPCARASPSREPAQALARPRPAEGGTATPDRRGSRGGPSPGGVRGDGPAQRRDHRARLLRRSTRTSSPSPSASRRCESSSRPANGAPLYNRAIAGLYPIGSTFKLITASPRSTGRSRPTP